MTPAGQLPDLLSDLKKESQSELTNITENSTEDYGREFDLQNVIDSSEVILDFLRKGDS